MHTDVTSGPLATSNIASREAWRGRSLVTRHHRRHGHGYSEEFETQLLVYATKTEQRRCCVAQKEMFTIHSYFI